MSWLEVHQTLQRHPKLLRLSAKLRIHRAQSAGHLLFLWLWTLDYSPKGDLSAFGPAEISAAAEYPGDAEIFSQALRETGWIDPTGHLHDWYDYAGKLIEKREADRERKAEERKKGASSFVHGTSKGNPRDGSGTLPNPTLPNLKENPGAPPPGAGSGRKRKPKTEYSPNSLAMQAAKFMWEYVRDWSPQAIEPTEVGYQAWAHDCDLMFRKDGRSSDAFNELLDWIDTRKESPTGFSWRKVILCPATLRKRWSEGKFADFLPSELAAPELK